MAHPDRYEAAGELLRALASPLRIAIVTELGAGARCVHELVDTLDVPQPLVSQHLRVLRGAGVVRGDRRGREIEYSLTDQHIAHIIADAISHAGESPQVKRAGDVPGREAPAGRAGGTGAEPEARATHAGEPEARAHAGAEPEARAG
jgi:DNA-binding transcriptional ArsR family regulator